MTTAAISITTPGLLFSTVSLIMLAYTNRFLAMSNLIRALSDSYQQKPEKQVYVQIQLLRKRAVLVKIIQLLCMLALLLSIVSMLLILFENEKITRYVFSASLLLMLASLVVAMYEIALSTNALNISIPKLEE